MPKNLMIEIRSDAASLVVDAIEAEIKVYDDAITAVEDCGEEDFDAEEIIDLAEGDIRVGDLLNFTANEESSGAKTYQEVLSSLTTARDLLDETKEALSDEIARRD